MHAYPFQPTDLSTFIVECHEDTWKRAGLDQASEEQTVEYCAKLFADHLGRAQAAHQPLHLARLPDRR